MEAISILGHGRPEAGAAVRPALADFDGTILLRVYQWRRSLTGYAAIIAPTDRIDGSTLTPVVWKLPLHGRERLLDCPVHIIFLAFLIALMG